uniref:Cenp-C1 n=1 Tax=Drosophila seriema TaxID=271509 RepID=A0A2R4RM19_9MUSC|nr:Cenp-C1 [Drosophila seriema]
MRSKVSETTLRELQDILNAENPDEERFKDFLKKKTAPKPPNSPQYVLGGYDVSFDIDVDLIKLPEKQQHQQQQQQKKQQQETQLQGSQNVALRETLNNSITDNIPHLVIKSEPQEEGLKSPNEENTAIERSSSAPLDEGNYSPVKHSVRAASESIKSCRVVLRRRSHVMRLRQELQEDILTVINETRTSSASFAFLPKVSSTPALDKLAILQLPKSTQLTTPATTPKSSLNHADFEGAFEESLMHLPHRSSRTRSGNRDTPVKEGTTGREKQESSKNTSQAPTGVGHRDTFVIDKTLEPKDLKLPSPTNKATNMGQNATKISTPSLTGRTHSIGGRQPYVLRRSLPYRGLPRSPQQVALRSDLIVSTTQSPSTKVDARASTSRHEVRSPQDIQPEAEHIVSGTQAQQNIQQGDIAAGSATSPLADICGIQTNRIPGNAAAEEIPAMEESDVEVEETTSPIDLAPAGGNTTRQRRRQQQVTAGQKNSTQLLDLHQTHRCNTTQQSTRNTHPAALNKPLLPAINGEEFAEELARLTNNEILDLRKRNSLGRIHHQQVFTMEQQLALEHSIQMEIVRRNLSGQGDGLPSKVTANNAELNAIKNAKKTPPKPDVTLNGLTNSTDTGLHIDSPHPPRRLRSRRRGIPISNELQNYLELPMTIKKRMSETTRCKTKRSLYTKGDSDNEDGRPQSPVVQQGITNSSIQIAPAPPSNLSSGEKVEDILIVPPPPVSLRYSRNFRGSQPQPSVNVVAEQVDDVATEQSEGSNAMIIDDIQIVPPPPDSLRYSRQLRRFAVEEQEQPVTDIGETARNIESTSIVSPRLLRSSKSRDQPVEDVIEVQCSDDAQRSQEEPSPPKAIQNSTRELSGNFAEREVPEILAEHTKISPNISVRYPKRGRDLEITSADLEEEQKEDDPLEHPKGFKNPSQDNSSSYMEELRVETPTPPSVSEISSAEQRELDEQPSTSKAAREALRLSTSRKQQKNNSKQTKSSTKDNVFKKPKLPAPRVNKSISRELQRLRITTGDLTSLSQDNGTGSNDNRNGVRRSKRGQIPLRNTWVHSVSEPFKSTFLERSIIDSIMLQRKVATTNRTTSFKNKRTPLCSSTPANGNSPSTSGGNLSALKRKRQAEQGFQESGISPLPEIAEEGEQQSNQSPKTNSIDKENLRKKMRNRVYVESDSDSEPEAAPVAVPRADAEAIQLAEQIVSGDDAPSEVPAMPRLNPSQTQLLQMADWLRGVEMATETDVAASSELDNNATQFTSVSDLKFLNLDGIEYSFYKTEESWGMGYMRFQPLQQRGMKRNKTNTLRFLSLVGEFVVEVQLESEDKKTYVLKSGDFIEIKMGKKFNIINSLNEVGLMIVNRK